jgi:ATP synthase protein I
VKDPEKGLNPWARAAQVTAMATQFAVSSAAGIMLGAWADEKLGTSPWLSLLGMILGLGGAIQILIVLIRKFEKENNNQES